MAGFSGVFDDKVADISPFADGNRSIDDPSTTNTILISLAGSSSEYWGFISSSGLPNNADWEDGGTWSATIRVVTGNHNVQARCRAVRIDEGGSILQSGTFTAFQTMNANRIYTITNPTWTDSDEDKGNRLAVEIEFKNNGAIPIDITIGVNTTTEKVETNISLIYDVSGSMNLFTRSDPASGIMDFSIGGHETTAKKQISFIFPILL